ncbi:MAG TPA: tetratricopeptide repeat protein [Bryobacteraceae bacterium]|nr:tetratricopeptide repeat protein [Bryobacteraceae bacterium]
MVSLKKGRVAWRLALFCFPALLLAQTPDTPAYWYAEGLRNQQIAEQSFARLQSANPTSPYVAALVADTRVQRRQYRSAFFFYNEALKQLPGMHGIHAGIAEVYRKTGHADWAAQEDAREAALPQPDCKLHAAECEFLAGHDAAVVKAAATTPEALYWRAKAANELALQAFFRLGQLPESVELHKLRAEIARGQGQYLEEAQEWRAALAIRPADSELQRGLAVSLFLAADYRAALEAARGLPHTPETDFLMGDSLLRLERPEEAIPHLKAALARDPKLLAADASLGLALARTGKAAEAIPHLVKALALDRDGSLHFQLAGAYRAAGQAEKAQAAMAKYQELSKRDSEAKEEAAREAQIGPPR